METLVDNCTTCGYSQNYFDKNASILNDTATSALTTIDDNIKNISGLANITKIETQDSTVSENSKTSYTQMEITTISYNLSSLGFQQNNTTITGKTKLSPEDVEGDFTGFHSILGQTNDPGSSSNLGHLWLIILIIFTITGSMFVCLAVRLDKRLHQKTFYFFVSLSILHIIIGITVMPLACLVVIEGNRDSIHLWLL